jgi:hypothetical protein
MSETPFTPEPSSEPAQSPELSTGLTSAELARACAEVLSEEDCADIEVMEFEEGLGFAFSLLIQNGIEDPEAFLAENGVLEATEVGVEESLTESLGFTETPELSDLHGRLVEALSAAGDASEIAVEYQRIAEGLVDSMSDPAKGGVALTIQLGVIAKEAGLMGIYTDYLEQARSYADNLGLDELVDTLDAMITEE